MGYLFSLVNAAVFAISLYSRDSTQRFLMILVLNDALRTSISKSRSPFHSKLSNFCHFNDGPICQCLAWRKLSKCFSLELAFSLLFGNNKTRARHSFFELTTASAKATFKKVLLCISGFFYLAVKWLRHLSTQNGKSAKTISTISNVISCLSLESKSYHSKLIMTLKTLRSLG